MAPKVSARIFIGTVFLLVTGTIFLQLKIVHHATAALPWVATRLNNGSTPWGLTASPPEEHSVEEHNINEALSSSLSTPPAELSKTVVVAKVSNQRTKWVTDGLPSWNHSIYVVDDLTAPLHTAFNKGHESSVYLTYILDNYDSLPNVIVFLHNHRKSWHVDAEGGDNVKALQSLQLPFVQKTGFVNLRCGLIPGCPSGLLPFRLPSTRKGQTEEFYAAAYQDMFAVEEKDVPREVSAPCCAQFAVSKEQVLKRPKADYERYLNWLRDTELEDSISGRVFEFAWHIIFGMEDVHCPAQNTCYCNLYGRC